MKKLFVIIMALVILSIPFGVYAATTSVKATTDTAKVTTDTAKTTTDTALDTRYRGCGNTIDPATLTDQQKKDLETSFNKMVELRKETIALMVSDGLMTQAQADDALARLEDMVQYQKDNGYTMMLGMMDGGMGRGMMGNGRGMMGNGRGMMGGSNR